MRTMRWLMNTRRLVLGGALFCTALGCGADRAGVPVERTSQAALAEELPPAPGNVPAGRTPGPVQPEVSAALPAPPDLQPQAKADPVVQQPNRVLYRSKETLGNYNAREDKLEKALPVRAAPASPEGISGEEYRRRADAYLRRWEQDKEKHAHLSPRGQEEAKGQLKREMVGE